MNKIINLKEAVDLIHSGDTVMVGGFTYFGCPLHLLYELADREVDNLTIISEDLGYGGLPYLQGAGVLINNGQVKEAQVSFIGYYPEITEAVKDERLKLTLIPQGTLAERIRAGGSGLGGFYTPRCRNCC